MKGFYVFTFFMFSFVVYVFHMKLELEWSAMLICLCFPEGMNSLLLDSALGEICLV